MIHEYRTYTLEPGLLERYLELAETLVVPIRGDRYGRLVGFWTAESGTLNQVHHVWEYASLDARQAARAELARDADWTTRFLDHAWPTMQAQEVRFMHPRTPIVAPERPSAFVERRIYRCPAGRFEAAADAVRARPRASGSTLVGVWTSESPQPNEICEFTAYADWAQRLDDAATAEPQRAWWRAHRGLFQHAESTLLRPIGISPLR